VLFRVRVGAEASIDFELELEIPVYSGFLFYILHTWCAFIVRVRLTNQSSVIEVETGFGLRGVFQYCVTGTEFVTLGNGIRYTN
jgi:hypothetical protein